MSDADAFERCIAAGGVAVFPADTVYGLACDPTNAAAVERLYGLKRRPLDKPSAVMFFDLEAALAALPELGERTRWAFRALLPGGVSFVVPNPRGRFPLACGADKSTLGIRVPTAAQFAGVRRPVLQSSANLAGGSDPVALGDVPAEIRAAADLVIDGDVLPGTPSTVIDLRDYELGGEWQLLREGAVPFAKVAQALGAQFHFDPASYLELMRAEVPRYDELQDEVVSASGSGARRILELGTGTGETARRLLDRHPEAVLVGIDASGAMLERARGVVPHDRAQLSVSRLEEPLPVGPFDLVVSALSVHHLPGRAKAELFARVASVLAGGGRFVLGDVVESGGVVERGGVVEPGEVVEPGDVVDPADALAAPTPLTPGYDFPSRVEEQLQWLAEAGLRARVSWSAGDLAVIVADVD